MPGPRFGPVAPRTSPGFTPVGSSNPQLVPHGGGGAGGFQPLAPVSQQNLAGGFAQAGGALGVGAVVPRLRTDPQFASQVQSTFGIGAGTSLDEIRNRYQRPSTPLQAFSRIVGFTEAATIGVLKSGVEAVRDAVKFEDPSFIGTTRDILELAAPWMYVNAAGKGFRELPKAVGENISYTDWIKESNNPDSFLYRHAAPIGIGLSFFADPTTYMTFGIAGGSKVAAKGALAAAWKTSFDEADTMLKAGMSTENIDNLAIKLHMGANRPFSLGDALDDLRAVDRQRMGLGGGEGVNLRGNLRGTFARGGRGVNFAGQQIVPGGAIGGALKKAVGRRADESILAPSAMREKMSFVIPDSKLMSIVDDARRTVAMAEFDRVGREAAFAGHMGARGALGMFMDNVDEATTLLDSPSAIKRGTVAIKNIMNSKTAPPFVPQPDRANLFKPGFKPSGPYKPRLEGIQREAKATINRYKKQMENLGMTEDQIGKVDELWNQLTKLHSDPVDVMVEFTARTSAKIHTRQALRQLVQNPMFARIPLDKVESQLAKATDDVDKVGDKLFTARKKLAAAKSPQQKAGLKGAVAKYEAQHLAAKAELATVKATHKAAEKEAGGRAVREREAWGREIGEDALPFKFEGKTYAVPAPIHEAMTQMQNPKFIDGELSRAFKLMNFTQNKWKILATSVNPSFHWMNLMGGAWNNMLGGIYNPMDYLKTMADEYRLRAIESGRKGVLNRLRPMSKSDQEEHAELRAARDIRGVTTSFTQEELMAGGKAPMLRATRVKSRGRTAYTRARRTGVAAALGVYVAPDEWVPDEIDQYEGTMLGAAAVFALPEIARAGTFTAGDVESALRMTPMRVAQKDKSYHQLMDAYSVTLPANFGKFMDSPLAGVGGKAAAKENIWDIGAALAMHFQFDYSRLTHFERYIAKSVFPFYTFYKNNFVLQAVENVKRPRFIEGFQALASFSEYVADDEAADNPAFKQLLPEYFDKLEMFQVPVPNFLRGWLNIPEDNPVYLNPKLPFAALNMFPPFWELANDKNMQPTGAGMQGMLAPLFGAIGPFAGGLPFKALLEYSVGYQLGLARPIDFQRLQSGGWRASYTDAPGFVKLLPKGIQDWFGVFPDPETDQLMMNASMRYVVDQMSTPFITGLGEPVSLVRGEETDKTRANTVAYLTGIRMTPVDPLKLQRGWMYRTKSFLEGQQGELRERGYDLLPDDRRFLKQIRRQVKFTERAWDAKQAELYGQS